MEVRLRTEGDGIGMSSSQSSDFWRSNLGPVSLGWEQNASSRRTFLSCSHYVRRAEQTSAGTGALLRGGGLPPASSLLCV